MILDLTSDAISTDLALEIICTLLPAYSALLMVWVERYFKNKNKWPDNLPGFMSLYEKLLESSVMSRLVISEEKGASIQKAVNDDILVNLVSKGRVLLILFAGKPALRERAHFSGRTRIAGSIYKRNRPAAWSGPLLRAVDFSFSPASVIIPDDFNPQQIFAGSIPATIPD